MGFWLTSCQPDSITGRADEHILTRLAQFIVHSDIDRLPASDIVCHLVKARPRFGDLLGRRGQGAEAIEEPPLGERCGRTSSGISAVCVISRIESVPFSAASCRTSSMFRGPRPPLASH